MNIAKKFQQIYHKNNTVRCNVTKLFKCSLKEMGVSLGKPRQIHLHRSVEKPELNTIKVFRLEDLPFTLPHNIHDLNHYVHNIEHKFLSDVFTPSIFLETANKTGKQAKLTTVEIADLPEHIVVKGEKVMGKMNYINGNQV